MESILPFGKPFRLSSTGKGGINTPVHDVVPNDDFGIYATEAGIAGPYGTPLLFRGTELECRRQYRHWMNNPAAFDQDMFRHRQNRKAA